MHEYSHEEGCSVTGGYAWREPGVVELAGTYVFADYCAGTIWGLHGAEGGGWERKVLAQAPGLITTFGEGEGGALYVAVGGEEWRIFRLDAGTPLPELKFSVVAPLVAADS